MLGEMIYGKITEMSFFMYLKLISFHDALGNYIFQFRIVIFNYTKE